jgi:D-3-phosphoglycerate dehydrogenase / 2-oxoglutarate reductase
MATNKKKVLLTEAMSKSGRGLLDARGDVVSVGFPNTISGREFQALITAEAPVNAVALGGTPFGVKELEAAVEMLVVARIGVGFDAVDIAALTAKRIPLMVAGTANSPSVAEHAMFLMLALAKRGAELNAMVQNDKWNSRLAAVPVDLYGKTVLIVGFGRIGTRTAKRCQAMEMQVVVFDPYKSAAEIRAAGCEPVHELEEALARADFVSIHCPKTAETVGMFNAARLARMKQSAYLVNTARGGIIDEAALHKALSSGALAGAGLDVFAEEPTPASNPLLRLANVISAPHMAGVTRESLDRMGLETARNILSVFDGAPIRANVINTQVLER